MKKEILFLFICLCLAGVLIAGCTTPAMPPATATPTATPVSPTEVPTTRTPAHTIIGTAVADGRFTTFVAALQKANLSDALDGPGPFTVFAPTDDAFNQLPNGTLQTLLADPEGQLSLILLYHIVPGEYRAADLVNTTTVQTLMGENLTISATGGQVYVDNAKIIQTDIVTGNGVIQVIDTVLIPPEPTETNTTGM